MLLNLLKQAREKMLCLAEHFIDFPKQFSKFNRLSTRVQMQDSIYHTTLKAHLLCDFRSKENFAIRKCDVFYGCQCITLHNVHREAKETQHLHQSSYFLNKVGYFLQIKRSS